jgi:mannitol operon transcriptional antiterminator
MLSSRSQAVLKLLLDSVNPLRVKDIAKEFGVSARTIKYDLDALRNWLQEYDLVLYSQPNKGIWIPAEPAIRNRIHNLLGEKDASVIYYYQSDRVKIILLELLLQDKPIRIAQWMDQFQVSRNTIQSDLMLVEAFLQEWKAELVRNREGIQVRGSEQRRRLALEYAIQDSLDSNVMLQMVQAVSEQKSQPERLDQTLGNVFHFTNQSPFIFQAVVKLIQLTGKQLGIHVTDRTIIGIYIRLCIVVHRLTHQNTVVLKESEILDVKRFEVYTIFQDVLHDLSHCVGIDISDHEIAYVCLHIIGLISDEPRASLPFDLFELTAELVRALSTVTDIDFNQDPDLIYPLFKHISDKMTKFQHGVREPNPLLNDIARNYKEMFDHVKQSSQKIFDYHGVHMTDSDIAYIVLHFQASLERIQESKKYRVMVVCTTGRGMARLLKIKLEHDMKNVAIVGSCSVLEAEKMAKLHEADLLVSIFPVVSSLPVVVVHPIPTKQDIQAIERELEALPEARTVTVHHDPTTMELVNQTMIQQGLELAKEITTQFAEYLPENRSEGLFYHILFMVNRLMFGTPYQYTAQSFPNDSGKENLVRQALLQLLSEKGIVLPEGELEAILHYFVWQGGATRDL